MLDDLAKPTLFPAPLRPEIEALETSGIAQVFELGLGRDDIVRLWVGEGDLPTPDFICDAAVRALRNGKTFYNRKRGIIELVDALMRYTEGLYGIRLDEQRLTVSSSGMTGILLALQTMVGPGDKVVVVSPVWPNITSAVKIAGGVVEEVVLDRLPEGGFTLDLDRLMAACDASTRAIFVNSPGNPSGWVMTNEEQRALLDFCRARGLWLIADEVYGRFVYDRPAAERPTAPSLLNLIEPEDPVIVINSFSKTWAMTGWRMGWLIHPPSLAETFDRLVEFCTSGAPHFLQYGCIAALERGEAFAQEMVERCGQGGELVFQRLSTLPRVRIARPRGSFYAFFALEGLTDSLAFTKELVHRAAVGLAPGAAFGAGGEGHLRLCFASSLESLSVGLDRLEEALR